jgi:hypothetical protein
MTYFVMALALVLGFTQCKKEQLLEPENEAKTVNITLNVGGNGGAKHDINTTTGAVEFQENDLIYVGSGGKYIGTLECNNSGVFSGNIIEPANGTEIYFYFVGGLTPSSTPEAGTTPSFTVDISDQSSEMPVLSCNHVIYDSETASYSCTLQNQCALVKFTTASTTDPVHVGGLYTEAKIDFANNSITNNGVTGFVNLHPDTEDNKAKWAVLLPQAGFDAEAAIAHVGYTTTIPTIAADGFITGDAAVSISTPSDIIYLDWLTGNYTATYGKILTGTLAANVKVSIADGATVTLDGVTINGVHNNSYRWAGITCNGDATIILKDGTTNTVKGFHSNYPGIYVPTAHTLTIQGDGSLTARTNTSDNSGAGIGAVYNSPCGNIEIQGGTVSATGGIYSAGIGSANKGACGNITISGGTVTANGGISSAGIGSGYGNNTSSCGNITISGGTVTANGNNNGAGIGTGEKGVCGNITISGGTVTARGSWNGSGIGSGDNGVCGTITIENTVKRVTAVRGYSYCKCIGCTSGSCGTVTIGGTVYSGGATPNQSDNQTFIYPNIPEGAINSLFSVSANKQVYFSQGNLQATTTNNGSTWTWSFATNQYDYIGNATANNAINGNGTVSTNGSIDLFCWSTNASFYGINNSTNDYGYSGTFIEWGNNAISNGGNTENSGWRTLTVEEWSYLFNTRTDAASKKGLGSVNGVNGLILLPDEWTLPDGLTFTAVNNSWANDYTTLQWEQMEANGAVFLPALGYRSSTTGIVNVGSRGDYWSSSAGTNDANARSMYFQLNTFKPSDTSYRRTGRGVRLVHNV